MTNIDQYLIKDKEYTRKEIHSIWGGSDIRGISVSREYPYIFLFRRILGQEEKDEYRWGENDTYYYPGEKYLGGGKLSQGNQQIKDHLINNKRIFLFEYSGRGKVKYVDEVVCVGYDFEGKLVRNESEHNILIFKLITVNKLQS
ncbi:hypothetical protein, partial [Bacillus thuringiensis]|uniref:hypothetical protein n=1 Tax=Bacillus thuringiensis TaxID=1428 RepID=UPI002FFFBFF0